MNFSRYIIHRTGLRPRAGWTRAIALQLSLATLVTGANFAHAEVKASGDNYTLVNNCQSINNLSVSFHVTQDLVAHVTGGGLDQPNGGFSMQLNASPAFVSPASALDNNVFWLQYGIIVENGQALGFTEFWDRRGQGFISSGGQPVIANIPNNTIPAGSVLSISLSTDSGGNVTGIVYSYTDPSGNQSRLQMPLPQWIARTSAPVQAAGPVQIPLEAFQVDVVGPINWEGSDFASGAGYIDYQVPSGSLQVPAQYTCAPQLIGTGEISNAAYSTITQVAPGLDRQYVTTTYTAKLAEGMLDVSADAHDQEVLVYYEGQNRGLYQDQWWWPRFASQMTGSSSSLPTIAAGSGFSAHFSPLASAQELYYLTDTPNGTQDVIQLRGTGPTYSAVTDLHNRQSVQPGSSVVSFFDTCTSSDDVFFIGSDSHVYEMTWSPISWLVGWQTTDLTAKTARNPALGNALMGHVKGSGFEVFYFEPDNHVHEFWAWSGCSGGPPFDGWHTNDLMQASNNGAPVASTTSPLVGFYDSTTNYDALFYVDDVNGSLQALYFTPQAAWTHVPVSQTAAVDPPAPGSNLFAQVDTTAGANNASEEVFYLDVTNNIRMLKAASSAPLQWSAPSGKSLNALTALSGNCAGAASPAPAAAANTPLAGDVNPLANTNELYYLTPSGQVFQLWPGSGGKWQCVLVTSPGSEPAMVSAQ
jgi:hypothetical protein